MQDIRQRTNTDRAHDAFSLCFFVFSLFRAFVTKKSGGDGIVCRTIWQIKSIPHHATHHASFIPVIMIRLAENFWERFAMDVQRAQPSERFMLWIDAVGGYWVCLGEEIVLGQPVAGEAVDVPILGDLSRQHARLRRDGEGYLIEALHEVRIDNRPVRDIGWLRDGSRIQLGRSVQLVFHRPNALSGTARLDFVSRHRTQPSADAVLWMADTCVLGPSRNSHVVCTTWPRDVILCHHGDASRGRETSETRSAAASLQCRTPGLFVVDAKVQHDVAPLTLQSCVQGEGFSFRLDAKM
jgi:hypothetical protein